MHPVFRTWYTSWGALSLFLFISVLSNEFSLLKATELHASTGLLPLLPLPLGEGLHDARICRFDSYISYSSQTCEELNGIGSLNTICVLNSDLQLDGDLCVSGTGSIVIDSHVSVACPIEGCSVTFNVSGYVKLGAYATLVAGSIAIEAVNISLEQYSSLNTTSLGGAPPSQTSGTPSTHDGAGGGHGGRGASCIKSNKTNWGGDVYAWSSLSDPWSYGSKGGSTSSGTQYGGGGGGRVFLKANDTVAVDGYVTAEGGEGGLKGGGGSGGSIRIHSLKLKGGGIVSAAGGRGWGGGGGGRIALECYSVQDVKVTSHGGQSIGCPENAGGAGTTFDKTLHSLKVSNDNLTTETETPLLDFPNIKLWSNIFVEDNAKVLVPLLWTRVQVRSQIKLLNGGGISFGLFDHPVSEFELVAEELLMSDSDIKVYGAFRMYVKLLLMWNSRIQIDGGNSADAGASFLEARNLVVLRQNSVISSNADLGVSGQGLLKLSGNGDAIKGRRLFLSLFYNIEVGSGSLLQAPFDDETESIMTTESQCESQICPAELLMPPEDCHVNSSLSFTLQICRVEDIIVSGSIRGSILHVHRARTVIVDPGGIISSSKLGCKDGIGKGKFLVHGAGGGAGHGGSGGSGFFNGTLIEGGMAYGDADLPCELGSGSGGPSDAIQHIAGGGLIVIGSIKWPLSKLEINGSMRADGQSHEVSNKDLSNTSVGGLGGGSGGTILLFLQEILIAENSSLSVVGGRGGPSGGGGGGGGRVHFHWSNIASGDEFVQLAAINGTIDARGGSGRDGGFHGERGTITGKECPKGLFGTFCNECPVGTYKDVIGSDPSLCIPCTLRFFPNRAAFTYVRGGVTQPFCPYKCLSEKYRMPKCYTPFEELLYTFGGPLPFSFILMFSLVLLTFILSAVRVKLVGTDSSYQLPGSAQRHGSESFPCLLSLAEVQGPSRAEETQNHVHRMYFMGLNTFREPWHLPYSPPEAIIGIVYEDAFNRFIDEINSVAAYEWWEGSVHSILSVAAYPCAWSWKQWRRKKKTKRLQEYVKSEYDHACLRSCRSRALYKGMKVGSTPDLMVAYIDFFLGGDEKRLVVASTVSQRFPMCIIFGGDGSYMSPYFLHTDMLVSNLISQYVAVDIWDRFTAGMNAQLRTVSRRNIRAGLLPVILWLKSHGNPQLECDGVRVELGWFQATASGYYQLGILLAVNEYLLNNGSHSGMLDASNPERLRKSGAIGSKDPLRQQQNQTSVSHTSHCKRVTGGVNGGIINEVTLQSLDYKKDFLFPFSLLLQNTRPVALQETLLLVISLLLLGDLAVTLLMLLQFYWISLAAFLIILLVLPLSLLPPFPAGINALFSQGPRKSSLARIYALWNVTSLSNVFVAFICGFSYHQFSLKVVSMIADAQNVNRDEKLWWILPTTLVIIKSAQALLVNLHIANLEIQDLSLFSPNLGSFWAS